MVLKTFVPSNLRPVIIAAVTAFSELRFVIGAGAVKSYAILLPCYILIFGLVG